MSLSSSKQKELERIKADLAGGGGSGGGWWWNAERVWRLLTPELIATLPSLDVDVMAEQMMPGGRLPLKPNIATYLWAMASHSTLADPLAEFKGTVPQPILDLVARKVVYYRSPQ